MLERSPCQPLCFSVSCPECPKQRDMLHIRSLLESHGENLDLWRQCPYWPPAFASSSCGILVGPIHPSIHLFIHASIHVFIHPFILYPSSFHPSSSVFFNLLIYPCMHACIHPSIYLFRHSSMQPFIHPSGIHLSLHLSNKLLPSSYLVPGPHLMP